MSTVLLKAFTFLLLIVLGYSLKRGGIFGQQDYQVVSKIMFNVTLPATIISSFDDFELTPTLLIVAGIGLVISTIPLFYGYLTSSKMTYFSRVFYMLNYGGYSIGSFTLPFIQSFLGPVGVTVACMFDMGNAVMMAGGSYALTMALLPREDQPRLGIRPIIRRLFSCLPFDCYLLMLVLALLRIGIPEPVITVTSMVSGANGVLAMLMIGMMFEPVGDPALLSETARQLALRYAFAALSALALYFFTPFDLLVRQTLAVLCFAPLSSLAPIYTDRCHSDVALASLTNSASIAISLVLMLALSLVFAV